MSEYEDTTDFIDDELSSSSEDEEEPEQSRYDTSDEHEASGSMDSEDELETSNNTPEKTKSRPKRGIIDDSFVYEASGSKLEVSGSNQSGNSSNADVIDDSADAFETSCNTEVTNKLGTSDRNVSGTGRREPRRSSTSSRNELRKSRTSRGDITDESADEYAGSYTSEETRILGTSDRNTLGASGRRESRSSRNGSRKSKSVIEDSCMSVNTVNMSAASRGSAPGSRSNMVIIEDSDEFQASDKVSNKSSNSPTAKSVKTEYGRESFRMSRDFSKINLGLLSSTIMESTTPSTPQRERFTAFDGKLLRPAMLTPREVKPAIRSRSPSPDTIEIISDDSGSEPIMLVKTPLKQPTLPDMFKKNASLTAEAPEVLSVSAQELDDQKRKVQSLQFDAQKAKNLLRTINLSALPDKGALLKQREEHSSQLLVREERILKQMIVDKEGPPLPKATGPKAASWQELDDNFGTVQPRTFGKQAMATHNQQKALTMDRLQQLHGSLKSCPTEDTFAEDPKGLLVELMPHQKRALAWLMWREKQKPSGGILADDMGLGKTLTMISVMLKTRQEEQTGDDEESENDENDSDNGGRKKTYKYNGGTLIVCPASLISQWDGEVKKRVKRGRISVELYHGPKRETKAKRLSKPDMVITTYSIVNNEYEKSTPLFSIKWNRIILDEAHQIRNYKAQTSIATCGLAGKSRWALTGTPIHNKELDLYSLLKFLRCTPFDDLAVFKRWVSEKNTGGQERLNTVMSSLMLRRTKAQLQEEGALNCLPERNWEVVEVKLEKQEMDVYQKVLIFSRTLFSQFLHQRAEKNQDGRMEMDTARPSFAQGDPNSEYYKMHTRLVQMNKVKEVKQHEILVLLLRLRQICCHPSLITAMLESQDLNETCGGIESNDPIDLLDQLNRLQLEDEHDPQALEVDGIAGESVGLAEATRGILNPSHPIFNVERKSSKLDAVLQLVKDKILSTDDKCIIVSQWTSYLRLLGSHLKNADIKFDQLDGSIPVPKRAALIDNFNDPKSGVKILLLSLTAGGVGLNLVGANHLLLLDLHWNPQLEMQAQDRIYRVGQKKPVHVYKFVTLETIEERIKKLQEYKKNMAEAMLTGAKLQQSKLSLDDLKMLFNM